MIRCVSKLARATLAQSPITRLSSFPPPPQLQRRFLYGEINISNVIPASHEMIQHALSLPKSEKSDESYAQGLLMLEQCLSLQSDEEEDQDLRVHNTKGMCLLAMSNLLYTKGDYIQTMEKLRKVQELIKSTLDLRVAALEALAGVNFELGRDDTGKIIADPCVYYLMMTNTGGTKFVDDRAEALKGFVNLVLGNLEAAESHFEGFELKERFVVPGALSYGELLHIKQNFSSAKDVYKKIIEAFAENKVFTKDFTVTYGLADYIARKKAKMEWPELIGLTAEEAEKKIKEEKEGVKVQVVQPGSFVTMDYREDRVRVYVGTSGKVERAPRIG